MRRASSFGLFGEKSGGIIILLVERESEGIVFAGG